MGYLHHIQINIYMFINVQLIRLITPMRKKPILTNNPADLTQEPAADGQERNEEGGKEGSGVTG